MTTLTIHEAKVTAYERPCPVVRYGACLTSCQQTALQPVASVRNAVPDR